MGIRDQMVVPFTSVKGAWSPRLLRPDLWIDARRQDQFFQLVAGTTAVTDGSVCGYGKDISGKGFDLSGIGDDSSRPNWVFNNGFSYLDCDSGGTSNTGFRRASSLGLYAAGACSVFMAVRANPGSLGDTLWGEGGTTSTPLFICRTDSATLSTSSIFVRTDASATLTNTALNTSAFDNTDRIIGFVWNGTTCWGYNNLTESSAVSLASGSTITFDSFAIGCRMAGGLAASNFEGRIYAVLAFKRALNSLERITLTKYLARKQMGVVL